MQLQLKVLDDEADPTKTVQRIESLSASDNPLAFLGGAGSDLHAAAAAVAAKNKTPYLGVAFALLSVHQRGLKYLFSPFPKSPALSTAIFDQMDGLQPKPRKVAIFAEKSGVSVVRRPAGGTFAFYHVSYYPELPFSSSWTFDAVLPVYVGGMARRVAPWSAQRCTSCCASSWPSRSRRRTR